MMDISKMVKNRERELSLILITMYMRAIFSIIRKHGYGVYEFNGRKY
jgi:hypothetical protein